MMRHVHLLDLAGSLADAIDALVRGLRARCTIRRFLRHGSSEASDFRFYFPADSLLYAHRSQEQVVFSRRLCLLTKHRSHALRI
eukprot:3307040-Pleurochrysis_carterae.AAC.1